MVKLQIKWNKEKYEVDMDLGSSVEDFKVLIYSLTNVPIDKQKVIFKGSVLQNGNLLSKYKLVENATLSLMGTAEDRQTLVQPS
jgi:ubiquitin carboxyl-terminal hydrolase 14